MTQSEQLAQVRKALDRAVGCLSLARNGMLEVTHLTIYTCDAVTTWLAYVVKQEEDMMTRYPERTMTITDVQMIVRDLFPEIREEFTIMLISGMLHGSLAQQGWDIID